MLVSLLCTHLSVNLRGESVGQTRKLPGLSGNRVRATEQHVGEAAHPPVRAEKASDPDEIPGPQAPHALAHPVTPVGFADGGQRGNQLIGCLQQLSGVWFHQQKGPGLVQRLVSSEPS